MDWKFRNIDRPGMRDFLVMREEMNVIESPIERKMLDIIPRDERA